MKGSCCPLGPSTEGPRGSVTRLSPPHPHWAPSTSVLSTSRAQVVSPLHFAHFAHLLQEASVDPPEVQVGIPGTVVILMICSAMAVCSWQGWVLRVRVRGAETNALRFLHWTRTSGPGPGPSASTLTHVPSLGGLQAGSSLWLMLPMGAGLLC